MPFPGPGAGQDAPRWKAIRWASRGPSAIVAMIFGKLNRSIRSRCLAHRNQPRVRQAARGEAVGKPSGAGVYTNQRLNLSEPWEGTRRTCQGLEPDPGTLAVRECVQ